MRPPPLSLSLSFRTGVNWGISGVLTFSFSFVSCRAAILILFLNMNWEISSILFLRPLQFSWRILRSKALVLEVGSEEGGGGVGDGGGFGEGGSLLPLADLPEGGTLSPLVAGVLALGGLSQIRQEKLRFHCFRVLRSLQFTNLLEVERQWHHWLHWLHLTDLSFLLRSMPQTQQFQPCNPSFD